jgi:alkylhydroperoxidase family enzyme
MAATLAQALQPSMVSTEELEQNYKPLIEIVRELIGVVPNCNPVLEIWPPGFRTFNVLVPNLLNLPPALLGQGAPKDLIGLAMYVSSSTAGCPYCTAHHCSFAIRRGTSVETIVEADYTPVEAAVADVARGLATVPATITKEHVDELQRHLSPEDIEWLVLAVALGGFLNKFMDSMGIELEFDTINDVTPLIADQGWSPGKHQWVDEIPQSNGNGSIPQDNIGTILRVLRRAPGAIRYDTASTKGVSGRIGPALMMLEDRYGYAFPILASLQHKKAVRAIATALRDSLDEDSSTIGVEAKIMTMLVYARSVGDEVLTSEAVQLASLLAPQMDPSTLVDVGRFALADSEYAVMPAGLSRSETAAVILAKAAAPSPANVNEFTVSTITEELAPPQIVEIIVWLSVLQMLHRLYAFYDARLGLS